jgi:hypothetical protein
MSRMYKIIGADREEYGPVSADQIRAWLSEGRADGRTMAQAAGSTDWKPLSAFPEFEAAASRAGESRTNAPPLVTGPGPGPGAPPRPDVPNYLMWSILVTVLCACVLGFPAIFYSTQVMSKLNRGDVEGAMQASKKARFWCWVAFCLGSLLSLGTMLFLKNWVNAISHTFQ